MKGKPRLKKAAGAFGHRRPSPDGMQSRYPIKFQKTGLKKRMPAWGLYRSALYESRADPRPEGGSRRAGLRNEQVKKKKDGELIGGPARRRTFES
jgi:hypothetical protein